MKNVYIKLLILTMMLLCPSIAEAYTITGQIVDKESGTPLRKAVIIARNDSSKVLAGLNSDQNGQFTTANIDCQNVVLEISRENYKTTYFAVSNETAGVIDIGKILLERKTIELQEVEVNAQSVIQKPDRYLIFPSAKEIARSASSLSLLNELKMKMPGLHVNEMLESVTIENRSPVFQINGKEVSFSRILTINNDNVLRIEYHDTPGIRYADRGVPGIINFVMKPRQDGGSVTASVNSALTTGNINANVGGTYYYKKSEWSLNYNNNWRRYDDQRISSTEQFIGRDMPIQRTETGLPSEMGYLTNRISLGYTYMHDANTMLSATIDGVFMNNAFRNAHSDNTQIYADETYKYKRHYNTDDDVAMPSLDIYFRKQIDKKSKIEIDAFASMSDGDYDRNVNHIYENDADNYYLSSMTQNSSSNMTLYDRTTGARVTKIMNVNGNWNAGINFGFNTPLDQKNRFNIHTFTRARYSESVSLDNATLETAEINQILANHGVTEQVSSVTELTSEQINWFNAPESKTRSLTLGQNLSGSYQNDWFEFRLNGSVSYNKVTNNTQTTNNRETFDYRAGASTNIEFPWEISLSTDCNYTHRQGYSAGLQNNMVMWNAQIAKSFLRGNAATIRFKIYDILRQQSNVSRSISAITISDTEYNTLGSYFMFNFIYKFNTLGGGAMRGGGRGPGRGPMGPPPGGFRR